MYKIENTEYLFDPKPGDVLHFSKEIINLLNENLIPTELIALKRTIGEDIEVADCFLNKFNWFYEHPVAIIIVCNGLRRIWSDRFGFVSWNSIAIDGSRRLVRVPCFEESVNRVRITVTPSIELFKMLSDVAEQVRLWPTTKDAYEEERFTNG